MNGPALFAAFPEAASRIPWLALGRFPTPVERIEGLLPPDVELWVKREDESSETYGGNKIRKLEFMLGDARAHHRSRVVTFGGLGSHFVTAAAVHAPRAGFEVEAALFPQPVDDHVRALAAVHRAANARIEHVRGMAGVACARLRASLRRDSAWLAGGGSSALGNLGWVSGAIELRLQERSSALPPIDAIYTVLGSGGTVAGLWWGLRWLASSERPVDLVAVRVVPGAGTGGGALNFRARAIERLLRARLPSVHRALGGPTPTLRIRSDLIRPGYGLPSAESIAAVDASARHGLVLDPIYTGKAMAALLADARAGRLAGKRVLFLNSFGTVASSL
jgi:D-cysteine desulfhydrase